MAREIESMNNPHPPHIAILPSPGMGHIIPLLELAKQLVINHGFHVTFLVITTEASPAQTKLLHSPNNNFPSGLQIVDLPPADVSSIINDNTGLIDHLVIIVKETLIKSLKSTLLKLHCPPKVLIIDMFCVDAFDTTKELSIPTYLFFTSSAALLSLLLYYPTFHEEVNGVYTNPSGTVQVPGCDPIHIDDLIPEILIPEGIPNISRFKEAAGILANTWDALENVPLRAMRENSFFINLPAPPIHPVGPLIKEADATVTDLDTECLNWLNNQPSDSVLYISFGSGGTLSAEQITELAMGLEQSQQRFIWVARKPTDSGPSGEYFNVGGLGNDPIAYLPEGFLERTGEIGRVVPSWAAQVAVLRHPSTGGFLTHCGWNSILESIVHGVPMIAWPLFSDQMMNASLMSKQIGVAVRTVVGLERGVVGREEIERVVRMVMEVEEGKLMRGRARELQDSAKEIQSGPSGTSLSCLSQAWKLEKNQ